MGLLSSRISLSASDLFITIPPKILVYFLSASAISSDPQGFPALCLAIAVAISNDFSKLYWGNVLIGFTGFFVFFCFCSLLVSVANNNFFYLTSSSRDYGFTTGTSRSKTIELTPLGRKVTFPESNEDEKANIVNAFFNIELFREGT